MFDDLWDNIIDTWWGRVFFGVVFLLIAVFVYYYVGPDAGRGSVKTWVLVAAHWVGGRLCAASIFAIPGVLLIGLGIYALVFERE